MIQKSKRSRKAQEEHSICRFEHPEVSPLPRNREFRQGLSAVTARDQSSHQQYHRNGRRMPQILYLLIKKGIGELQDDNRDVSYSEQHFRQLGNDSYRGWAF